MSDEETPEVAEEAETREGDPPMSKKAKWGLGLGLAGLGIAALVFAILFFTKKDDGNGGKKQPPQNQDNGASQLAEEMRKDRKDRQKDRQAVADAKKKKKDAAKLAAKHAAVRKDYCKKLEEHAQSPTALCTYKDKTWWDVCKKGLPKIPTFRNYKTRYLGTVLFPSGKVILSGEEYNANDLNCYDIPKSMVYGRQRTTYSGRRSYAYRAPTGPRHARVYRPTPRGTTRGNGEVVDKQARRDIVELKKGQKGLKKDVTALKGKQAKLYAWMKEKVGRAVQPLKPTPPRQGQ